jgi:hypothetical protein
MFVLAAQQPNFLPYAGYFERIALSDVFVVQDDLQYTKQDWQNRVRIWSAAVPERTRWLTVAVNGGVGQSILQKRIHHSDWAARVWRILSANYLVGPRASDVRTVVEVGRSNGDRLADANIAMIECICRLLGITTEIVRESTLGLGAYGDPNDRLIELCSIFAATDYLAGPGGANYLNPTRWAEAGCRVRTHKHEPPAHIPTHGDWIPGLSIVDSMFRSANARLLFELGLDSAREHFQRQE